MASHAPSPDLANPLFALLDANDVGDDLRHQIVEISDLWNASRLDRLLEDIQASHPTVAATRARLAGEEAARAVENVGDHVTSRRG